ncbi:hypothetical protein [Megasphaera hominis]|jgi:hypothetical protein|uniref:Uncharacterized protein n=1 Tax=Megasphaera hominis TaxID=159836 RepID=A0ABR6VJ54_9FIRM|nr:hypothetical protein [Megasphaera hominis]MBC3537325.1 hypothetical protein [Megasphaera hominis]
MYQIFGALCVISLIMLIVSLIKPKWGLFGQRPSIKRKQIAPVWLVLMIAFSGLANYTMPADVAQEKAAQSQSNHKKVVKEIGVKAGIGDTFNLWEKEYGEFTGDMVKSGTVNGSHVTLVVVSDLDNRVVNIVVEPRNKYYKNDAIKDMLPSDAQKLDTSKDTSDPMVTKEKTNYHSDTLAEAFPETNGNFSTIDVYNGQIHSYISTTIDCTPN